MSSNPSAKAGMIVVTYLGGKNFQAVYVMKDNNQFIGSGTKRVVAACISDFTKGHSKTWNFYFCEEWDKVDA